MPKLSSVTTAWVSEEKVKPDDLNGTVFEITDVSPVMHSEEYDSDFVVFRIQTDDGKYDLNLGAGVSGQRADLIAYFHDGRDVDGNPPEPIGPVMLRKLTIKDGRQTLWTFVEA